MPNLLRTKLFIPPTPSDIIPRPRLLDELNRGLSGKLSLVMAPAGYGKTTLVTSWLNQLDEREIIWLSLDESDNEPRRFFSYFVGALAQLDPEFDAVSAEFLRDQRNELATDAIMTALLNQLVVYGKTAVFILDDYHEIENPTIHEAIAFWLDNQPPNFQLVMTSRTEPPLLTLPRMRVRRQVTELGSDELRFSRSESADFLNQHMHLNLSEEDIAQLDDITEGWVASLQLAALSLQNNDDPSKFIQTFKGDNRYIVDYLVNEVLNRQPGYIRDFLLQTSILERLNVQLCNAVTGQVGSQHILETLDQARLFVIPLDDRRHWYRYHHLFADCLQAELYRIAPDDVANYHERASHWFSEQNFLGEAIQHAFTANNNQLAADLIAQNARTIHWELGEMTQLWSWLERLPDKAIYASPQLLVSKAWLHLELHLDRTSRVDELLDTAVTMVNEPDAPYSAVEIANMGADINLAQAALERARGNLPKAIEHCQQAVQLIEGGDSAILKAGARGSLAGTFYQAGLVARSLAYGATQLSSFTQDKPLNYARYIFAAYMLDAMRLHGQLNEAERLYHQIEPHLQERLSLGAAMFVISRAEILYEQNQLNEALEILEPAIELLKPLKSMAVVVQVGTIIVARIWQIQGKGAEALKLLKDTLQKFQSPNTYSPAARISATEARIHLQRGNFAAAKTWAEKNNLQAGDDPSYLLEIDYLVFVRILIADGDVQAAQSLLGKLEQSVLEGERHARLIEVYILQALVHQALGDQEQAIVVLGQAVEMAKLEGFMRVFVDEGKPLAKLLTQIAGRGVAVTYLQALLPLFDVGGQEQNVKTAVSLIPQSPTPDPQPTLLLNPLTDRELATLRYLASSLTIPEIAEQMVVAPSTIRTYVKRIYGKLDVHSRVEAVNRARALNLLD